MIRFLCESCGDVKRENDVWLLGLAAESLGITAARREINVLPVWDRANATLPLAVHFCSVSCKDSYIAQLFSDVPPVRGRIQKPVAAASTTKSRATSKKRRSSRRAA
jgi:hypothetical protein